MKNIDNAVIELNGVLPANHHESHQLYTDGNKYILGLVCDSDRDIPELNKWLFVCDQKQFQQRAKELGFVGKYRWGVVYETDGKRPELADDVVVSAESKLYKIGELTDAESAKWNWKVCVKFKITDQRFKPADTSYLDKPDSSTDNGADWYDYDNQEMKTLPDSNSDVELLCGGVYRARVEYIGIRGFKVVFYRYDTHEIDHAELPTASFRPLDHDRKAKAERKRVVDAAFHALGEQLMIGRKGFELAYDKGFLRLPD